MKKELLFMLGDFANVNKNAIAATCAWLANVNDYLFELYYDSYRSGKHYCGEPFRFKDNIIPVEDYFGSTVLGGGHHEQFYLLNGLFKTSYLLIDTPTIFESSIRGFDSPIINSDTSIINIYTSLFKYFKTPFPDTITILGMRKTKGMPLGADVYYCSEIFFNKTIGVSDYITNEELLQFKNLGVMKLRLIGFSEDVSQKYEKLGFAIQEIKLHSENDDYGIVSINLANERERDIQGVSISDPVLASYFLPWLLRHRTLPVFSFDLPGNLQKIAMLAKSHNQKVIYGRQNCDNDILELSKHDLVLQIVDPNRPPFPVVEEANFSWSFRKADYSLVDDISDEMLVQWAEEGRVLTSLLFHAGDVRHSSIIWRIFDFVALYKLHIGIGVTADWWNWAPELMELTSIPMNKGGMFPYIEPILYAGGLGITAEGKGYHSVESLIENLSTAKNQIKKIAGTEAIPKGYYTFLDIQLRDWRVGHDTLYESLADQGFDYLITSLNPGKSEVHYTKNNFVTINHSVPFFSFYSNFIRANNLDDIINSEDIYREFKKPGWVLAALDSPIWGFEHAPWECGDKLKEISEYMTSGGNTGNLINTTPSVIARYAKIIDALGLLV